MWWKTSSGRQERYILKTQNGLPYPEKSKRFSCYGPTRWDSASNVLSLDVRVFLSYVGSQPRLMSLSYPWVYCWSSPILDGQPTKANEPHLPGVSLVTLCQILAVTLSFWSVSRRYHMEVEVGLRVCATQWMFLVEYGAHSYQHPVTMLTPFTPTHENFIFLYKILKI